MEKRKWVQGQWEVSEGVNDNLFVIRAADSTVAVVMSAAEIVDLVDARAQMMGSDDGNPWDGLGLEILAQLGRPKDLWLACARAWADTQGEG